ncbi:outer membrane protein assembly factor BamA [Marinobacterium nitratireducens]|uniref:Outer membrane protein assembly factor BamA n=1 Tax=Marinobacterium nitratireducens TaxID=518897 RepID=A0A917ZAS5_9GAMM|nr:outer membrane protein assembly factor BamA [Marinobacterium nitratireducens]GGO78839.1 outer membrane protein assembly factor BamA [Marinobacterium nitratireducens]
MKRRLGLFFSLLCWGTLARAAISPFTVTDIRLEGLQRVDPGSVFRNFPIASGDLITEYELTRATRELFETGNFDNIELLRDGDVLIVRLTERPAVSLIRLDGNKVVKDEALMQGLKQSGLEEGEVFKRAALDRIQLELQRLYVAQGRYGAGVETEVEELPGNRVALNIDITEGSVASIQHINVVGNKVFSDEELKELFELQLPNMWSFITDSDRYSREKLAGDQERLRSWYLDRGYINFSIDSTQVSISPDRQHVYITINITEGEQFKIREVDLAGDLAVPESDLASELSFEQGDVFSRQEMTDIQERLQRVLGDGGYMFANVSPVPTLHEEDNTVSLRYFVEPGQRTYVRRILIKGNTTTADEVLRQQLTQMEAAVASAEKIEESKNKLSRTGYFKTVDVETRPVPGTNDQVDVEYTIEEQPSGQFTAAVGFSQSSGFIFQLGVQQDNFFGTGKQVGFNFSNSDTLTEYSFNYTDPFYTVDGVSRGFNVFYRERDYDEDDVSNYTTDEFGAGVNFGYPINEYQRLSFGLGFENITLDTFNSTADEVFGFIEEEGDSYLDWLFKTTWSNNHLNRGLFPTSGWNQTLSAEIAVPGSDLSYFRSQYRAEYYLPLNSDETWVVSASGRLGYGDSFGSNNYPFFKNYYAGGLRSVRGFDNNSLGPRDSNDDAFGGNLQTIGSLELIFPTPFLNDNTSWRTLAFVDGGNVFTTDCLEAASDCTEGLELDEIRYSAGVGLSWLTPVGPLSISLAMPLNDRKDDETEVFQFSLGQTF